MSEDEDDDPCSDACTRMVCEWCPEYDRQAALVEQFRRELDTLDDPAINGGYQCSQEPHSGAEFYGSVGGCGECGYRPSRSAR